ncbi:MAG: acetyltransferase [Cyanobacteria bacterium J06641_5]
MTSETPNTQPASAESVVEIIAELEQYRQRIVDDATAMAQKLQLPKKSALAKLEAHPELARIDKMLAELRAHQPGTDT